MAISKVVYGTNTLIDLTSDTVTAQNLVSGITAHKADGTLVTGALVIQHYYTGTSDPSSSVGVDGDIYLKVVE